MKAEKEELERQNNQLMESNASNKRSLKEIEDKILYLLYNAEVLSLLSLSIYYYLYITISYTVSNWI